MLEKNAASQWDEVITGHDHDVWGASTRQPMFLLRAVVSSFASNTIREPFTAFQFDKCFRVKEKAFYTLVYDLVNALSMH